MATIGERDSYPTHKWDSHDYPFEVNQAGRLVYFGRAMAQQGSWHGTGGEPGYITMDPGLQTLTWNVQFQHRPVRLVIYHEDDSHNPSAVSLNIDYYYREKGMQKWDRIGGGVSNAPSWHQVYGETRECRDGDYRLVLQTTDEHYVWVVPYNQYLQAHQFYGKRQVTR